MVKRRTKIAYGIGGLGKNMMFAMSMIMSIYLIDYVGMPAMFVGMLVLVVRIWDAINDFIMGNIVDNTKTRWGKFRPWILVGTVLNIITLLLFYRMPTMPPDSIQLMIYITVFYVLWGMTYTLMDIPFWALIPALTKDKKDRESLAVYVRFFTNLGMFAIVAPYVKVVKVLGGGDGDLEKLKGFFILACIVAGVFLISQIIVLLFVKEEKHFVKERITLAKTFKYLFKNDQLLTVVIVILMFNLALYVTSGLAYFFFKYDVGNEDLFVPFVAIGGIAQFVAITTFPLLSKRFSRKRIFQISIITPILGCMGMLLTSFLIGNSFILLIVFSCFVFYGIGLSLVVETVFLSDSVEYGEWKFGERTEGVVFSVQTFIVKLANALANGLVGIGLSIIGFEATIAQNPETINGMRIMMFSFPIVGLLIALFIYNKYYLLTEEKYDEIIIELEQRKIDI